MTSCDQILNELFTTYQPNRQVWLLPMISTLKKEQQMKVYLQVEVTSDSEELARQQILTACKTVDVNCIILQATCFDPISTAVWYDPVSIRQHFEAIDDSEFDTALVNLTDEQLYNAAKDYVTDSDSIWEDFHNGCTVIVQAAVEVAQGVT